MQTIKVVTLNMWGEQEPLETRLNLMCKGLKRLQPDIIGLQEVRDTPARGNLARRLAEPLGMELVYEKATPWGGGDEGLALLSRFPVVDRSFAELPHAHEKERRLCLHAAVETPAGVFSAFTTHLNYRLTDGAKREDQVVAVDEFVAGVQSKLPKVLMGDFNAIPESDEIRYLRGLHSIGGKRVFYQDAYERRHSAEQGHTWSRRNPYTERLRWLERDRRLDYIFVTAMNRDGSGVVEDCRLVLDEPDGEGHYASDHFALYAEIQVAPLLEK